MTATTRLVQIVDEEDGSIVLMADTNLTEDEISTSIYDESLDEENYDWEEKLSYHADLLEKYFKRIYIDEIITV